jgi:hypothetical protein
MQHLQHILADSIDGQVRIIFWLFVVAIWAISAIAGKIKKSSQAERERLRAVRQAIQQSQQIAQQKGAKARPPVQLAPEIARRVPPPRVTQRPQVAKRPPPRPPVKVNYKTASKVKVAKRPVLAPPPLPVQAKPRTPEVVLEEITPIPPRVVSSTAPPVTVGASAIRRWLRPSTLRQQFILTELFQTPLAFRQDHLR